MRTIELITTFFHWGGLRVLTLIAEFNDWEINVQHRMVLLEEKKNAWRPLVDGSAWLEERFSRDFQGIFGIFLLRIHFLYGWSTAKFMFLTEFYIWNQKTSNYSISPFHAGLWCIDKNIFFSLSSGFKSSEFYELEIIFD